MHRQFNQQRQPIFNLPNIVILLMAVMLLVQIIVYFSPKEFVSRQLVLWFGFFPLRLIAPEMFSNGFLPVIWTIFTHSLLHASWEHLFVNLAWLAIFGTPVARRYGAGVFLIIFFISAAMGALLFAFFTLPQMSLLVGASGGISGLTGVAIRFIFQPVKIAKDEDSGEIIILGRELANFRQLFANKTSRYFIIIWVGLNALIPLMPLLFNIEGFEIAWQAHLGGFFAGLFLAPLFEPNKHL